MTPRQLRAELESAGVELWVDGDMLRYRAPAGMIGPDLVRKLREQKQELVYLITMEQSETPLASTSFEPATVGQQALWYLYHSDRESPAYNVASAARIHTLINPNAFQSALEAILARHESLRTVFQLKSGIPHRSILNHQALDFRVIDGTAWQSTELAANVQSEYERPFDLERGPLLRARLYKEATGSHVFLLVLHHIVFDSWSLWLLLKEFQHFYAKAIGEPTSPLPKVEATYSDFARWQSHYLEGEASTRHWHYWEQTLAGAVKPVELPCDSFPKKQLLRGASQKFQIPNSTTGGLLQLGRQEHATPFMALLATFFCLLRRYTDQNELVIGIGCGGRTQREFAPVIGYFVNTLPIRVRISPECSFRSVLRQVRVQVIGALKHQDYPFPLMVKRLSPSRGDNTLNFCNVMFGLQKPQNEVELAQLFDQDAADVMKWGKFDISPIEMHQQEGQFDLNLELLDSGSTFTGLLKYNAYRFESQSIQRLAEHFQNMAQSIALCPDSPVLRHEILSPVETELLLKWSQASFASSEVRCQELFNCRFARMVAERPEAIAIAAPERLTYGDLDRRSNQFAHVLVDQGVKAGDRVACLLQRSVDAEILILALFKIGAIYVPVDPAGSESRIAEILRDSNPRLILAHCGLESLNLSPPHGVTAWKLWDDYIESARFAKTEPIGAKVRDCDPAYILYTSGSTGHPKGVVVSQGAISKHLESIADSFLLRSDDCVLQFANFTFDPSLEQFLTPLAIGARIVIRTQEMWTAHQFWEVIANQEVTVANLPPAYFRECTRVASADSVRSTQLRLMIVGGDLFPADTSAFWNTLPVLVLNAYGPTESVITATTYDISDRRGEKPMPIGRPKPGMSAYVLTPDQKLAPIGVPGELCLGGEILALGYWRDEDLTNRRFVRDPFAKSPTARLYKTGDCVRWNQAGDLEFLGRLDRQVKINGVRIEPAEIETALRRIPQVKEAAVVSQMVTDNDPRLVAYIECQGQVSPPSDELRRSSREHLPANMVPDVFMILEQIPRNVAGKVDYAKLPVPDGISFGIFKDYAPARTAVETLLVKIWEEVLKVERIGIHDHFLDLGGGSFDSLRIATLAAEKGMRFSSQEVTPDLLFHHSTIAALAEQISLEEPTARAIETS